MNNDSFIRATGRLFRIMEPDPQASALNQNILSLPLLSKNVLRWRRPHLWLKIYESTYEYLFMMVHIGTRTSVTYPHFFRMLQAVLHSKSRPPVGNHESGSRWRSHRRGCWCNVVGFLEVPATSANAGVQPTLKCREDLQAGTKVALHHHVVLHCDLTLQCCHSLCRH